MDGVNALDVGSHVLDPRLQVIGRVVGNVVNLRPVCGLALGDVELCLGAGLVHQVVPKDGRVLPAKTTSAEHTQAQSALYLHHCNAAIDHPDVRCLRYVHTLTGHACRHSIGSHLYRRWLKVLTRLSSFFTWSL